MDLQTIRAPDRLADVRATCSVKVALVSQVQNICSVIESQKALSRICDCGIMYRLTVRDTGDVLYTAHNVTA
jgi:hypothetical protein